MVFMSKITEFTFSEAIGFVKFYTFIAIARLNLYP